MVAVRLLILNLLGCSLLRMENFAVLFSSLREVAEFVFLFFFLALCNIVVLFSSGALCLCYIGMSFEFWLECCVESVVLLSSPVLIIRHQLPARLQYFVINGD